MKKGKHYTVFRETIKKGNHYTIYSTVFRATLKKGIIIQYLEQLYDTLVKMLKTISS